MDNIYYNPEAYGLTIVDSIDSGESYDFDMVAIWRDVDGNLYWATDSGCSCPTPFESYTDVASLDRLTRGGWKYFEATVRGRYSFNADDEKFLRDTEQLV
jgi:hypothetical protein